MLYVPRDNIEIGPFLKRSIEIFQGKRLAYCYLGIQTRSQGLFAGQGKCPGVAWYPQLMLVMH